MKGFICVRVAGDGSDDRWINPAHIVQVEQAASLSRFLLSNGGSVVGQVIPSEPDNVQPGI